jgi:hypothetical protein
MLMLTATQLRGLAFLDVDAHRDAVALLRRHRHDHLRAVAAARDVLPLDFLLRPVQRRPVEDPGVGQADFLQCLLQRVGVELLVARDVDPADGRPFLDDHDEDAVLHFEPYVAKKAGREQRLDRLCRLGVVDALADLDGQVREHGARLGALDALDPDVLHDEGFDR